jgi:hypothetical protein
MKKILFVVALIGLAILAGSGSAMATLYPSLPSASYPVAGESLLTGGGFNVYIDWVIYHPAASTDLPSGELRNAFGSSALGKYLYLYQLENPANNAPTDKFYLANINPGDINSFGYFTTTYDLDSVHNLGANDSFEPGGNQHVYSANISAGNLIWNFEGPNATGGTDDGVSQNQETKLMWFISGSQPIYITGTANYSSASAGNQYASGAVPGPAVPEPMSLSLLGMGLLGAMGAGFRRKK